MSINIFYDNVKYRIRRSGKVKEVIREVIRKEKKISGDLNFILSGDSYIRGLNEEYLSHNYNTDVLAFDYSEGDTVNGEVYISLDTVKRNATRYKVSLDSEIIRVMIHGTLHLIGYDDKGEKEKEIMRKKEDEWLGNEKLKI